MFLLRFKVLENFYWIVFTFASRLLLKHVSDTLQSFVNAHQNISHALKLPPIEPSWTHKKKVRYYFLKERKIYSKINLIFWFANAIYELLKFLRFVFRNHFSCNQNELLLFQILQITFNVWVFSKPHCKGGVFCFSFFYS